MKRLINLISVLAVAGLFMHCDDSKTPTGPVITASNVDPQLIGTWIPWSLLTQSYTQNSWQDTIVVTSTKFLEGSIYVSPGISSCKLIADSGNIGHDCGSKQYHYDYTISGDMLYCVLEYTSATQTVTATTQGVSAYKKKP
jgi:hypothetical protein